MSNRESVEVCSGGRPEFRPVQGNQTEASPTFSLGLVLGSQRGSKRMPIPLWLGHLVSNPQNCALVFPGNWEKQ